MGYSPKCPYCEIKDYVVLEKIFGKLVLWWAVLLEQLERLVVALEVRLLEQL